MNISKFFIDRPIFAAVLSMLILLAGVISVFSLPVSEYPEIIPPTVTVSAQFPGANPKVIAATVASPLEEKINGVEDMLYMQSQTNTDGTMTLTVTFKLGTDPNLAQQLVQNRVSQALPRLPADVQRLGVTTVKGSPAMTMTVHLISPNDRYDMAYLRNYALINVKNRIERISGVSEVQLKGSGDYSMRIWLDPKKVASRDLTATDVIKSIQDQNVQVAAGLIGSSPSLPNAPLQLSVNAKGRLSTVEEFENIVLKASNGAVTHLRDVARIELGAADYGLRARIDNKPAVALWIYQLPGANSLDISDAVHEAMQVLQKDMPAGVEYKISYDPPKFVRASINAVIHTLVEAILLVVLVVIVFLQTWRASLIPLLAVPVSIVGTFALMQLFGFSINALSLFGLVLAIGIVVDDAIVVVENVERNIESGLSPKAATYKAMQEVSGPIVAIALTLVAVFVPLAFMSGISGQFYKQFAMTIAISTVISAFNSLTLSPAMAALLLRGHDHPKDWLTRSMDKVFGGFFRLFNNVFHRGASRYAKGVRGVVGHKTVMMALYAVLLMFAVFVGKVVPTGFIPQQDKDYLITFAQLPSGATLDRTDELIQEMSSIAMKQPGVWSAAAFPGLSINGFTNSSSAGVLFVVLDSSEDRKGDKAKSAAAIANALKTKFASIKGAYIGVFPPPPVLGLGTLGGFKLQLEDQGDLGYSALDEATQAFVKRAMASPELASTFSSYQINVPQLDVELDRVKALQLGVPVTDVFNTMQVYLGSLYVNDFNLFGRVYQVRAQADAAFRANSDDIGQLKTRNDKGEMVPLSSLVNVTPTFGPEMVVRYNGYTAADVSASPAPGYSTGQAQAAIERIAAETLPRGVKWEWTDLAYQQKLVGNSGVWVFPISVLLVFMVLAALYESLALPMAVIMIVPMSILSALTGVWLLGGDNNIFTQIGLMVLVGLSAKNAILIVEFARELEMQGTGIVQAAIEASRLRLRPILMTSFAFIMGVVPLVVSTGPGAEMRYAMGIAVFFGMLGVTFFGLFLTPVFYVLLRKLSGSKPLHSATAHQALMPIIEA
ncbi:efflux RND transporter permease subunit [Pseudomonas sp. LB3P14]